jgi:endonuclease/exonuclease/phosphatase family metal-dependent hydrolase
MVSLPLPIAPLRIVTYNVRYFGHATRGLASTAGAVKAIADSLARLIPLPDLICLQEVETTSLRSNVIHRHEGQPRTQLERFADALHEALRAHGFGTTYDAQYFRAHNYGLTSSVSVYTTGLAMLVRRPLRFVRHNGEAPADITHRRPTKGTVTSGRGLKQTRICAHAIVEGPGGEHIDVFNTHFSLPAFLHKNFWTQPFRMGWGVNQLEEARQLAEFVERERGGDSFVVVGDFNALPGSPVYDFFTDRRRWFDPLGRSLGDDVDRLRRFPTAGFMHLRMHLDHIFYGPGIRWADVADTHPFGDPKGPFHGLSDHVPLVGRFTVARDGAIDAPGP